MIIDSHLQTSDSPTFHSLSKLTLGCIHKTLRTLKVLRFFSPWLRYTARVLGRKFSRYLVKETFWLYVLGVAAFCLLLSIDVLTTWARWLIEYEATFSQIGQLMLYKLPYFLHLSLPIAAVFAILLATGRLAKDSELKAAYASGVPPLRLLLPLFVFGLVVGLVSLVNNGFLEPLGVEAEDTLVDSFFYTRPPAEAQPNVAYRIPDVGIYYVGRVRADLDDPSRAELSGVYIVQDDGTTVTALTGIWNSGKDAHSWTLNDAQVVSPEGVARAEPSLELPFDIDTEVTETLVDGSKLSLSEQWRRLSAARRSGNSTRDLAFSFHQRIADAFSAAIFALIAGALGLYLHNRAAGFGWTIVLLVLFWALWQLSSSLFDQQILSPFLAAWLTTGVVGALGLLIAWFRLR